MKRGTVRGDIGLCDSHGLFEDNTNVSQEMEVKTFPLAGHAFSIEIQQKSSV